MNKIINSGILDKMVWEVIKGCKLDFYNVCEFGEIVFVYVFVGLRLIKLDFIVLKGRLFCIFG